MYGDKDENNIFAKTSDRIDPMSFKGGANNPSMAQDGATPMQMPSTLPSANMAYYNTKTPSANAQIASQGTGVATPRQTKYDPKMITDLLKKGY